MHFKENYDLQALNSFGLSCFAKKFIAVDSEDSLVEFLGACEGSDEKLLILGGGSNILFTQDFDGIVVKNEIKGINVIKEDQENVWLKVGAGEIWHHLVLYCVSNNWAGIENLSLIPGTVGAAPIQNIGAYGVEVKNLIKEVETINITTSQKRVYLNKECDFGYRDSIFKRDLKGQVVISSVIFKLKKNAEPNISYGAVQSLLKERGATKPTIRDVSDAIVRIRKSKLPDPKEIGNAGSFFKNPVVAIYLYESLKKIYPSIPGYVIDHESIKIPAGWLIEQAGWKGKTIGAIGVHKNQALVLVNYGGGKGMDLTNLAFEIKNDILTKFGIDIVPEVNML